MTRDLLIVTNDFPPRRGGIQSMIYELARRLPADRLAVYCSDYPGSAAFDAMQDFPVYRHPGGLLTPTPRAARRIVARVRAQGTTRVWYGASAPLGLLAPKLSRHGVTRQVATSHGHEVGWAGLPIARQALRRIGEHVDVVTYLGDYTRRRLEGAFGPNPDYVRLAPGVDSTRFTPAADGECIRQRHGLIDSPVVVCVSRLVPRKGQDTLIRVLPELTVRLRSLRPRGQPPKLLLVGEGPYDADLQRLAAQLDVSSQVVFAGAVDPDELPRYYAAGDVFAMPCRTRRRGMDVEGLGIVYLEASAVGRPVVAGDSGGAPDAVRDGQTGYVVGGTDSGALADRLVELLADPALRSRLGTAGRQWVIAQWQWDAMAATLAEQLHL